MPWTALDFTHTVVYGRVDLRSSESQKASTFAKASVDAWIPGRILSALGDAWHPRCGWRVAAPLGAHDAVDDGHADARQISQANALQEILTGGMLCLVEEDEVGAAAFLDEADVELAHPRRIAGSEAERDLGR